MNRPSVEFDTPKTKLNFVMPWRFWMSIPEFRKNFQNLGFFFHHENAFDTFCNKTLPPEAPWLEIVWSVPQSHPNIVVPASRWKLWCHPPGRFSWWFFRSQSLEQLGKKKSNRVRAFLERSWKILECKIRWGLDVIWNKGIRSSYTQGFDPTWAYSTGWMIISTKTGLHWQHLQYQSGRFAIFFFGSFWIHLVQQYNKPCCIFLGIDFSSKDFEGFGPNFSRLPSTELPIVALPLSVWFEGFLHHRTTATCQDLGSDEKSILPPDDLW